TLARFLAEGFFLSHLKRMGQLYSDRREFFIEQFNNLLGDRFVLQVPEAGLHLVAWLRCKEDLPIVMQASAEMGIRPLPLSFFCIKAQLDPALIFGFAAWSRAQIREALIKFASLIKRRGAHNANSQPASSKVGFEKASAG